MKKVLILTLGTGMPPQKELNNLENLNRNELKENLPYNNGNYIYLKDTKVESAHFISTVLAKKYRPDKIYVIGSIKSCWSYMLLDNYREERGDRWKEDFKRLYEMEKSHGKDTSLEELNRYGKIISDIFQEDCSLGCIDNQTIPVYAILTRYGLNDSEIKENYAIFKNMINEWDKEEEYAIAFDITHSFRSLPVYNLAALNYIKNLTEYKIHIQHIFYGMFDVKREMPDGVTPIIDYLAISDALELTNGVSELKHTGNAKTLYMLLKNDMPDLSKTLEKFDWAMQINDRSMIKTSLNELVTLWNEREKKGKEHQKNIYSDVYELLETVLFRPFQIQKGQKKLEYADAEFQYYLTKWCLEQNRYGQALATGLECLRSYMVQVYLYWKGDGSDAFPEPSEYEVENNRKAGIDLLTHLQQEDQREAACFARRLEKSRVDVVGVRNTFAHNLLSDTKQDIEDSEKEVPDDKRKIEMFIDNLTELKAKYADGQKKIVHTEFCNIFKRKDDNIPICKENVRIILVLNKYQNDFTSTYLKKHYGKNKKKKYDLVIMYVKSDSDKKISANVKELCNCPYVSGAISEGKDVQVLFIGLTINKTMIYMCIFNQFNIQSGFFISVESNPNEPLPKCLKMLPVNAANMELTNMNRYEEDIIPYEYATVIWE